MIQPTIHLHIATDEWLASAANPLALPQWAQLPYRRLVHTVTGAPVAQATTIRLVASPTTLWVRFDCADADAWATLTGHDDPIYTEEVVELFIASGSDRPHRYYELEVNPLNTRFDGIIHNPDEQRLTMTLDTRWDPPWQSWTAVDPAGWQCCMAIPWHSLGVSDGRGAGAAISIASIDPATVHRRANLPGRRPGASRPTFTSPRSLARWSYTSNPCNILISAR